MTTSFLRISNFLSQSEYQKLKSYFTSRDLYQDQRTPENGVGEETNPTIIYKDSYFEFNGTYEEEIVNDVKEISFIEDFLLVGLEDVKRNEILDFESYCYNKGLSTKNLRIGHLEQVKKKFLEFTKTINNALYLPGIVKEGLIKTLKEIIKKITREIGVTYLNRPEKLKIKLPKNQIEALFYILWKNGKIQATSPSEIGSVLDYLFQYQDENGVFQDVYQSRKEIADYQSGKGIKTPLEELKSFFTDQDTYQI
jgi:hypothetical protein